MEAELRDVTDKNAVELISLTPGAESLIAYMARVSSPHQDNPTYSKLIRYLIDHSHWSPFEMCHAVFEIETSRAIAAQLLRHRSFSFQEFSQRYSSDIGTPPLIEGRQQAVKNRQSSTDSLKDPAQDHWLSLQEKVYKECYEAYTKALNAGVAREQARLLLPLATPTRMYMAGSIRSWIHYIELRTLPDTQKEHRDIAVAIQGILSKELPVIAEAMKWVT